MKKKNRRFMLLLILAFSYVFMMNMVFASSSQEEQDYYEVIIEQGDTLWEIASDANQFHKKNVMDIVYLIADFNHLDSGIIHPGQTIKVPLP